MKKTVFLVCFLFSLTSGFSQHWNIVSQNDQNSTNFIPEKVWLSPTGNKIAINVFTQNDITLMGQEENRRDNTTVLYYGSDTVFNINYSFRFDQNRLRSSTFQNLQYLNDSMLFVQMFVDSGDAIFSYQTSRAGEIIRTVLNLNSRLYYNLISDAYYTNTFQTNSNLYSNRLFYSDTVFASKPINLLNSSSVAALLKYDLHLTPMDMHQMTFFKPDSTVSGSMRAIAQTGKYRLLEGGTAASDGKIFDVAIDDAKALVVTDTSNTKKDVFIASKYATFPYMNYDGDNLYFTCDARPRQAFVVNTAVPNYSFGKIDSSGVLEWVYALPPNASVVQDTAFRTYVFGHLRNDENYFGNSINSLDLYMAVIDPDGTILHFETDSNWFWPNTYFYKLMYSKVTGVNLFMSHVEPVKLGELDVPNDSGKQNMFLARFKYIEPEDTSTVAIDEKLQIFDFQLFPNPANESIQIKSSEEITLMRVLNVHGQELSRQEKLLVKEKHIDVSSLSPGVYFLQLHSKYGIRSKQFVKE